MSMPVRLPGKGVTVWFITGDEEPKLVKSKQSVTERNAFDKLMTKSTRLIETILENNRKDMLCNDIVKLTQSLNIRLPVDNFVSKLIKCLTNALCHVDGNHSKINATLLEGKCKSLPDLFSKFFFTPIYTVARAEQAEINVFTGKVSIG